MKKVMWAISLVQTWKHKKKKKRGEKTSVESDVRCGLFEKEQERSENKCGK